MEEILELFTDPLWLPLFFRAVRDPLAHEPSPAFQRLMTFERTEDANIIQALLRAFGPCLPSWTWDIFMVCPADVEMRVPADVANLIVPMPALGSLAEADAIFAGIFLEDEDFERCEYTSAVAQSALATGCWITRSDGSLSLLNPVNESVTIGTLDFGLILTISHAFLSSSAPPPPPHAVGCVPPNAPVCRLLNWSVQSNVTSDSRLQVSRGSSALRPASLCKGPARSPSRWFATW